MNVAPSRWTDRLTAGRRPGAAGSISAYDGSFAAGTTTAPRADRYVAELLRILGRFGARKQVGKGASLFEPGDTSRHLYMVETGTIDICLPEDPARHPIASFRAGASFLLDFGGYQVAALEAAEESVVVDIPFSRLRRLCRQEMELRLLLRQCHAFDVKSFLDVCYPGRSRFRLVRRPEVAGEESEATRWEEAASVALEGEREFIIAPGAGAGPHSAARAGRRRRIGRRARLAAAKNGRDTDGDN